MRRIFGYLFRRLPDTNPDETASELNQTRHRLVILVLISLYIFLINASFTPKFSISPGAQTVLIYFGFYAPVAVGLHLITKRWPGHYPLRRIFAMTLDAGSLAFAIACEPITLMLLLMVLVWITLGYGMRFGTTYLMAATGITLIATTAMLLSIPWTESTPYLSATILLIIVAIPAYARWLLNRIEVARAEAEAANLAKSRMLAQASHDLRQPIHAMSLLIVSLEQSGLNEEQKNIVSRIDRSLQGVARLFRSLLDLSTLDSGTVRPTIEQVDLNDLLREVVLQNLQQAEWSATDLRLVETSAVVLTDRNLLTTMVQNLVSNALKFSAGQAVLVGCRTRAGCVAIEVWDQGVGIEPHHQQRVFEEFYQVRERGDRDHQGVGLGLSILSRMARLLALQVSLRSQPGKGSCFTIAGLPRYDTSGGAMDSAAAPKSDWSPLRGLRVVLVEDDEDVLVATAQLLRSWQCEVHSYLALPAYRQECDVLVTDFDLGGGVTGSDVIAQFCNQLGRTVPAIVITGHDGTMVAEEIADPSIAILRKPLRPAELRSALLAASA